MEHRINIVELLNGCPKGMELYSPIFGKVYLDEIRPYLAIVVTTEFYKYREEFLYDGRYGMNGECMLFPSKEQRDWSKFQRPFMDGDIIYNPYITAISILRSNDSKKSISYVFLNALGNLVINHYHSSDLSDWRFATEEEKVKIFKVIKDHGYVWNTETKTLRELVEQPKFKVVDRIRHKDDNTILAITGIKDDYYFMRFYNMRRHDYQNEKVLFKDQDQYELVHNKFDISSLKPFDKVLVRTDNFMPTWTIDFYDGYQTNVSGSFRPFGVLGVDIFNNVFHMKVMNTCAVLQMTVIVFIKIGNEI